MIRIRMPDYPRKVETSKARRIKYFKRTSKIPVKYQGPEYIWKKGRLFNANTGEFVIANPIAAGTPNYAYISGNEIYARMHERVRMKVVSTVKNFMRPFIAKTIPSREELMKVVSIPLAVRLTVRTQYDYANWDVDNLWIYHKCLLDTFRDLGLVDDDNILFVREAGMVSFQPILPDETPELVFTIMSAEPYEASTEILEVKEDYQQTPGFLSISPDNSTAYISVGKKKIIFGAAKDALRKLMFYCLNYNKSIMVSAELHKRYENFFKDFPKSRIKIIINGTK